MRRCIAAILVCVSIGIATTVAIAWISQATVGPAPGIGGLVHFGMSGTPGVPDGWIHPVPAEWPDSPFGTAVISPTGRFDAIGPMTGTTVRLRQGMGNGLQGGTGGVEFSNDDRAHVLEVYRAGWPWMTMARRGADDARPRASTWIGRTFERGLPIGKDNALPLAPIWPGFWLSAAMWGAISGLFWTSVRAPRRIRRWRRRLAGRCESCGYQLAGMAMCPECGHPAHTMHA